MQDGEGERRDSAPPAAALAGALALSQRSEGGERYLEQAAELVRLQIAQLHEEQRFEHFHHFSAVMKALFEAAAAVVVIVIIAGAGAMLWAASHDDGLLIEPFSVPQEMAARGLTGQVAAARLLDKLASLQSQTQSNRAASSYANDWGDDIRVQIPETGVSVSQLYTYLSQWLGHQTHISGEVFRDANGKLAVTARVGSQSSPAFSGSESDFDALMQKAAESVYAGTQPYRYAVYLSNSGRGALAEAAYRKLIGGGSDVDRSWAYIGLSSLLLLKGDFAEARGDVLAASRVRPGFAIGWYNLSNLESLLQHSQAAYDDTLKAGAALQAGDPSIDPLAARGFALQIKEGIASTLGDSMAAHLLCVRALQSMSKPDEIETVRISDIGALAGLHDAAGFAAAVASLPPAQDIPTVLNRRATLVFADLELAQWQAAQADLAALQPALKSLGALGATLSTRLLPAAQAWALLGEGRLGAAEAAIAPAPLDCDLCVDVRGRIAAAKKDWPAAGHWFALQARNAPGMPSAFSDWGEMKLAKGDYDGAIAKFAAAHAKGPHFADPLELWGEALMTKNRSDLALVKFEEASKYAPNWGRLHLKWGEALMWSGRHDEAETQFAVAGHLFLTPAEKAQLARMETRHG